MSAIGIFQQPTRLKTEDDLPRRPKSSHEEDDRRENEGKPQYSEGTAGWSPFPLWLGTAGIISALIVGKAWSSAQPPSRSRLTLRIMNGLPVRANAEQCMVDNQNDDRANNGDQDTVKI